MIEHLLAAVGFVILIKHGKIFSPMAIPLHDVARRHSSWFGLLLGCSLCLGFWAGSATYFIAVYDSRLNFVVGFVLAVGAIGKHWSEFLAQAIFGVVLSFLLNPFVETIFLQNDKEMLFDVVLAGLRAAPVCMAADLLLQRLET